MKDIVKKFKKITGLDQIYFMQDFIYKHITKLSWFVSFVLTLFFAWIFIRYPLNSFLEYVIRLYIFGFIWWLIFSIVDDYAMKYRKKILLQDPSIWKAYIKDKQEELNKFIKGEN